MKVEPRHLERAREWLEMYWQADEVDPTPEASFDLAAGSLAALIAEVEAERDAEWEQAKRLGCDHLPPCVA